MITKETLKLGVTNHQTWCWTYKQWPKYVMIAISVLKGNFLWLWFSLQSTQQRKRRRKTVSLGRKKKKKKRTGGFCAPGNPFGPVKTLCHTWQMGLFAKACGEVRVSSASLLCERIHWWRYGTQLFPPLMQQMYSLVTVEDGKRNNLTDYYC